MASTTTSAGVACSSGSASSAPSARARASASGRRPAAAMANRPSTRRRQAASAATTSEPRRPGPSTSTRSVSASGSARTAASAAANGSTSVAVAGLSTAGTGRTACSGASSQGAKPPGRSWMPTTRRSGQWVGMPPRQAAHHCATGSARAAWEALISTTTAPPGLVAPHHLVARHLRQRERQVPSGEVGGADAAVAHREKAVAGAHTEVRLPVAPNLPAVRRRPRKGIARRTDRAVGLVLLRGEGNGGAHGVSPSR